MKILERTEFGNPILRRKAARLSLRVIKSPSVQSLINDMRHTLKSKKMGVGLAAPQVGKSFALAVIAIHPTPHRPKVKSFDAVIINPVIIKRTGTEKNRWEGCLSAGKDGLFAKVPRYNKITLNYLDENGLKHQKQFNGLQAQVIQHEVDHLNGVLFVDIIKDTSTYMTLKEYKKRIVAQRNTKKAV